MLKYPKVITVHYLEKLVKDQEMKELKTNQPKAPAMSNFKNEWLI
jgi:hypothetical protein